MFGSLIELVYELKQVQEFNLYLDEVSRIQDRLSGENHNSLLRLSPPFQHYFEWVINKNIIEQNINNSKLPHFMLNILENALKYDRWSQLITSANAVAFMNEKLFASILSVQPPYVISYLSPKAVRLTGIVQAVFHRSGLVKELVEYFSKGSIPQEVQLLKKDLYDRRLFFLGDKKARIIIKNFIKSKPEFKKAVSFVVLLNVVQIFKQLVHDLMLDRTLFLPEIETLKKRVFENRGWGVFNAKSTNPILTTDFLFILFGEKTSPDTLLLFNKKRIQLDPRFKIKIEGYFCNKSFLFGKNVWSQTDISC